MIVNCYGFVMATRTKDGGGSGEPEGPTREVSSLGEKGSGGRGPIPQAGAAFLLAQLGAHAAARFAARIGDLDLTPPEAGLIRAIAVEPGRSQQALAEQLGTPASRLVALIDSLEARGVIERRRNPSDRRLYALHLTADGRQLLEQIAAVATAHERDLMAALSITEHAQLRELLGRVAAEQDLTPGVHPGYRTLRSRGTQKP